MVHKVQFLSSVLPPPRRSSPTPPPHRARGLVIPPPVIVHRLRRIRRIPLHIWYPRGYIAPILHLPLRGSFDLFRLRLHVVVAAAAAVPECIPPQQTFYWKVPCDGQTFQNRVQVSNVTATQKGKSVDSQGGLDISIDLDLLVNINDQYGTIAKPLVDVGVFEYSKSLLGKCEWKKVPTLGILDNIDGCKIVQNCHLTNKPTTLTAAVNVKDLAGPLYAGINTNEYYGLTMTFKDDKTPILCVYSQDIVIKK